jgi:hypothetical protein
MPDPSGAPRSDTLTIHTVPASEVDHPEDNHGRELVIDDLLASLPVHGQLLPGVCARGPDGRLVCIDGNRRLAACRALRRGFLTIILDRMVGKAEAIETRLTANFIRRNMTLKQIGQDVAEYMDATGCTQKEAGARLGFREGVVCRALSLKLLSAAEERRLLDAGLCWSGIAMIAPLTGETRSKALEFACTRGMDGEPCRKEALQLYVKQLKSGSRPGRKRKALRLVVDGLGVELQLKKEDTVECVIERLRALAAKLARYKDLPPDALGGLVA